MAEETIERSINTPLEFDDYNMLFRFKKKGNFSNWKDLFHWICKNKVLVDTVFEHLSKKREADKQESGQTELH